VAEVWGNLSMDSTSPRYALSLINDPEKGSKWIALEDLTSNGSTAALKRPATGTYTLAGGNDGLSSFGETDIVGDASAQTGIYAFDGISGLDCQDLVIPYLVTNPTAQSLISYCETRRDMMVHFFRQLSSGADVSSIRDYRQSAGAFTGGTNFDSSYGALYAASTRYLDPLTNVKSFRLPVGDLVAALNFNDTGSGRLPDGDYGVFLAPAGEKRGRLSVDDVEFDVAQGARTHLVTLGDQNHINAIHRFNGKVIIGDAWTLRRDSTLLQWTNVRRMMIFMETRVSMIIQSLMFEQNNPRLWRKIHSRVKPFLDRMVALGAMYEYRYDGDQDARNLTSAKVNLPDDIANGKFRCRIFVKPTPPARELQVEWVVTKLSATFTEALADL
jgi:phage tail sheath protein FI